LGDVLTRAGCGADDTGRKLSKIIKSEAKAEKAALHVALKELAEIQKLQKESIKVQYSRQIPTRAFLFLTILLSAAIV
jgi:hypothetical protein